VSVRVLAGEFVETRSLRRIRELNADLVGRAVTNQATSDQYSLFRAYVDARHGDGGMADMSVLDYSMMVEDSHVNTRIIEYRRHGPTTAINGRGSGALVAACLTDILADGLSMVYSFYDPDEAERSLGTFMILDHLDRAQRLGLPHLYLGYWVEGSKKMAYKARFRPQERLGMNGWERIE
jgi:arginine-tRNA-protein transferase